MTTRDPVVSILRAIPSKLLTMIPATKQQREWNRIMGAARELARRMDRLKSESCQQDELMFRTLLRILAILGPNVQTLSVFFESRWLSLPFWEGSWQTNFPSLPVLTELTITYRALVHAEWSQWRIQSGPASLPSLRRLDISGIDVPFYTPFHCYRCISRRAPSLTHLFIPVRMVDSVKAALAQNRPNFEEDLRGILPSHLEHVFIQLARPPQFMCCGGERSYADDCAGCRSLSSEDERFAIVKADSDRKSYSRAKQEWMDRIDGGEGNWHVDNRIIGI